MVNQNSNITYGSVITGDIVASQQMELDDKDQMLEVVQALVDYYAPGRCYIDEYRGDSFQIVTNNRFIALRLCLFIKARFIKESRDVRLSLASSEVVRWPTDELQAEGKALVLSGRGLELITSKDLRFLVQFDNNEYQSIEKGNHPTEFGIHSLVLDDIMKNWTKRQAEVIYYVLYNRELNENQTKLAYQLEISQQAVSKITKSAKWNIIKNIIERYQFCVDMNYDVRLNNK